MNGKSTYNEKGEEILDPTPIVMPVGFKRPKPLNERIQELVSSALIARELQRAGIESFEEADDFNIPDETFDPRTPYEETFDPLHTTSREQEIRSGMVEEMPRERKEKARERIEQWKTAKRDEHRRSRRDDHSSWEEDRAVADADRMGETGSRQNRAKIRREIEGSGDEAGGV